MSCLEIVAHNRTRQSGIYHLFVADFSPIGQKIGNKET
jgi:hypothetical protein